MQAQNAYILVPRASTAMCTGVIIVTYELWKSRRVAYAPRLHAEYHVR